MHPDRNKDYSQPYFNSDNLERFFVLCVNSVLYFSSGVLYAGFFFVYLPKYFGEMHDPSAKWQQHKAAMM